jgi:hypothetical protein
MGDDVTSGQKAPLGRKLRNFRCTCAHHSSVDIAQSVAHAHTQGIPFGALPVVLSVMRTFCTTVHTSGPARDSSGHVTNVTSDHVTSGSTTSTNMV